MKIRVFYERIGLCFCSVLCHQAVWVVHVRWWLVIEMLRWEMGVESIIRLLWPSPIFSNLGRYFVKILCIFKFILSFFCGIYSLAANQIRGIRIWPYSSVHSRQRKKAIVDRRSSNKNSINIKPHKCSVRPLFIRCLSFVLMATKVQNPRKPVLCFGWIVYLYWWPSKQK